MTGYKTIFFVAVTFLVALANDFGLSDWQMPADIEKWYALAVPLVFALLRVATKTPIFKKE